MHRFTHHMLVCALIIVAGLGGLAAAQPGTGGTTTLPALSDDVEVYWDEWHVPHIYATNIHDAYYVQGYIHASKRFFSMDFTRRFAGGRLAEVLGEDLFGNDILREDVNARWRGYNRIAERNWQALDQVYKDELQAYADGVNAFLDYIENVDPTLMPPEYNLIGVQPADLGRWHPVDSLLILVVQAVGHTLDMGDDLSLLRKTQAWIDRFEQAGDPRQGLYDTMFSVIPTELSASATAWPDGSAFPLLPPSPGQGPATFVEPGWMHLDQDDPRSRLRPEVIDQVLEHLEDQPPYLFGNRREGNSNAWAVRGSMTTTGHPMFATDPHIDLSAPALFFECHINTMDAGGDLDLAGAGIPGTPGVAIGFNRYMAWGLTNGQMDVTDTYVEDVVKDADGEPAFVRFQGNLVPIERIQEIIPIRDGSTTRDFNLTVLRVPHHGMVLRGSWDPDTNTLITFRNQGYEPSFEYAAFSSIAKGTGVADFFAAMDFVTNGQSFVVADTADNILFMSRYKLPIRDPQGLTAANPPWLPYDGTGPHEWQGAYPKEKNIWELNSDLNYVATSNQDPVGATFDGNPLPTGPDEIYLGDLWDIGFRNARIEELLSNAGGDRPAGSKIDIDFMKRAQGDTKSALGRRMTSVILDAIAANPQGLAGTPEIAAAEPLLQAWGPTHGYETPAGTDANATVAKIEASAATCAFNAWLIHFIPAAVEDEYNATGEGVFSSNGSTYGLRGMLQVWDSADNNHILWDDLNTPERETRDVIILRALQEGVEYLVQEFGSLNTDTWRWGELHHVTFESQLGIPTFNIPPSGNFPRPGDGYAIDAAGDWVRPRGEPFSYDSGPGYRLVVDLTPGNVQAWSALPGGQDGRIGTPHYADAAELWVKNEYHPFYFDTQVVVNNAVTVDTFSPNPATPTPTATATPVPVAPSIYAAGYLTTDLEVGIGGTLTMWAFSPAVLDGVELAVEGTTLGVPLTPDVGGVYFLDIAILGPTMAGELSLELLPLDGGNFGEPWPYLTVSP